MSGSSPTDRLVDGFVPSSVPPMAPDGGLQLDPAPLEPPPARPISICELGPCRNYHELASKMDAQEPLDGSRVRLPVFVTRTCYPSPGIEMDLAQPVRECSLWAPFTSGELYEREQARDRFIGANPAAHAAYLKSWEGDDASR